jgi:putative membrane protein
MFSRIGRLYRAQWHALGSLAPSFRGLVFRIVLSIVASAIAFGIATWLTPGISSSTQPSVLTAVILLGIVDVLIRPLLLAVALPIGLIAVALIGLLLRIVAFALILPAAGYEVDRFLTVVVASFIYGAVLTLLS